MRYAWVIILIIVAVNALLRVLANRSQALAKAQQLRDLAKGGAAARAGQAPAPPPVPQGQAPLPEPFVRVSVEAARARPAPQPPPSPVTQRAVMMPMPSARPGSPQVVTVRGPAGRPAPSPAPAPRSPAATRTSPTPQTPPAPRTAPRVDRPPVPSPARGSLQSQRITPTPAMERARVATPLAPHIARVPRELAAIGAVTHRAAGIEVPMRRALANPRDLRLAFVLSEVLGRPVGDRAGWAHLPG